MQLSEKQIEDKYMQYEYLVRNTLERQYPNYYDFAKSHGLELDDLLQIGKLGLHRAILDYNAHMGTSFKTYAISKISYALLSEPKLYSIKNKNNRTYDFNYDTSIEAPINKNDEEGVTLHDILEEKVDFIQDAEFNAIIDNIAKKISPRLAIAVKMKYESFTLEQIGEKLGISSQGVSQMLKKNQDKLADMMLA